MSQDLRPPGGAGSRCPREGCLNTGPLLLPLLLRKGRHRALGGAAVAEETPASLRGTSISSLVTLSLSVSARLSSSSCHVERDTMFVPLGRESQSASKGSHYLRLSRPFTVLFIGNYYACLEASAARGSCSIRLTVSNMSVTEQSEKIKPLLTVNY